MALTVNGEAIDDSVVREETKNLRPSYYQMVGDGDPIALEMQLRNWSKENVIERVLLRQAAPEGDVETLLSYVVADVPPPKPKEISEYYAQYRQELFMPEMVNAAHILEPVDESHAEQAALANIQRIQEDLKHGLLFGSLAKELGWIPRGRMTEDLERAIFALEPGETSAILQSNAGFHIVRISERRPEGVPALEDVREHIEGLLLRERQQGVIEGFIDRLKARAVIQGR